MYTCKSKYAIMTPPGGKRSRTGVHLSSRCLLFLLERTLSADVHQTATVHIGVPHWCTLYIVMWVKAKTDALSGQQAIDTSRVYTQVSFFHAACSHVRADIPITTVKTTSKGCRFVLRKRVSTESLSPYTTPYDVHATGLETQQ